MNQVRAKSEFAILILKSPVRKLSDTINGQHFVGFFLFNEEKLFRS